MGMKGREEEDNERRKEQGVERERIQDTKHVSSNLIQVSNGTVTSLSRLQFLFTLNLIEQLPNCHWMKKLAKNLNPFGNAIIFTGRDRNSSLRGFSIGMLKTHS